MKRIGFIGIGVMGASMVRNLMKHGFEVSVYSRTKEKADLVVQEGAAWCDTVAQCAKGKDAVITMVGYPKDVEEVYFGERGILAHADPGTILIDMTTTSPHLSQRIWEECSKKGLFALDAPVSGGDSGAKNATLSIMVGGDSEAYEKALPLFQAMGSNILYQGKAGNGQHTKMANQIALSGIITSLCEALEYGKNAGLDLHQMLSSINKGAAGSWQMDHMAPRILGGDLKPAFFIKHYIKDMKIAQEEAAAWNLTLPILQQVLTIYQELAQRGLEDLGTQAVIKYYENDETL